MEKKRAGGKGKKLDYPEKGDAPTNDIMTIPKASIDLVCERTTVVHSLFILGYIDGLHLLYVVVP